MKFCYSFLSFSAVQFWSTETKPWSFPSEIFPLPNAVWSCTLYKEYTTEISLWNNFHTNTVGSAKLAKSVAGIRETAGLRHNARIRAWPLLGTKWLQNFTMKIPKKDRIWCNPSFEPKPENHIIGWTTGDGKHQTVSDKRRVLPISCCPVTLSAQP